jgi:hypothetical protein
VHDVHRAHYLNLSATIQDVTGQTLTNHEPMDKNQIEGGAEQGEQANDCKALVVKAQAT